MKFLFLLLATCHCLFSHSYADVSVTLSERQLCDIELLLNQGFAPLQGFMDKANYDRVLKEMRLLDGTLWPIPIVLDVSDKIRQKIENADDSRLSLCDHEGTILAYMDISEIWTPNKEEEALCVYGTTDHHHSGVDYLFKKAGTHYIGGKITKVSDPKHYDFPGLRKTPHELKALFKEKGYEKVVAFQTRNPMHRAHVELTMRAAQKAGAHLLLHPAVGKTKPGDVDYFTRVKCYQHLLPHYPEGSVTLSLLPIAMRMAGPKEALWHAIIRKNYGCTHFIVGRDHAGPGKDKNGVDFYSPYAAQELVASYADEIGIEMIPFKEIVYVQEDDNYQPVDEIQPGKTVLNISGTQLRKILREGLDIPTWFTYPEVVAELRKVFPPKEKQGITLFFTGLSAAGKSAIANALSMQLMEMQDRPVTLLDGDLVRMNLSSELGFSKEHRSLNIRRVGFVAHEITKNGGIALCALIAPFAEDRLHNRHLISENGNYIEIYVSTSLQECEKRDPKGLYSLARQGKLTGFTGIDDPYEEPTNAEIVIDTAKQSVNESATQIIQYLIANGLIQV